MNLKETLHMPSTDFPMRAGLAQKEPLMVRDWNEKNLYGKMKQNRINAPIFMLHDGPPYANGDIHCGHALNRCLKDFIVRFKNMEGYRTPFIFGWDTHGLPIEVKVIKSGVDRKKTPIPEFRKICEEYAKKQVSHQREQIRRLGCMGDYEHPYLTLLPEFEARQIDVFASMALKGLMFKGVKPVYWSPSSESALAEAEVEYHDVTAKTMFVAMKVVDGKGLLPLDSRLAIWTTTPWTIPTNQAIAVNPRFAYGLFNTDFGPIVFLSSLQEKMVTQLGLKRCDKIKEFKGEEMEFITYSHPLCKRISPVIVANYVTDDSGTGLVHIAPDFGVDDFNACLKYEIKPMCPVDERGVFRTGEGDPLNGLFYENANDVVIEMLTKAGAMLKEEDIVHSYPHDWRTKKPVIFRATPQWFCSIEPIRQDLLNAVESIEWMPAWGKNKMINMIKDRADWCISRQRVWGVPIPIIYNEDGSPIIEKEVFQHIRELVAKFGSNVWFEKTPKELLPEGYSNPASPHGEFRKETDIMDVWFDSGSSWNGVLVERGLPYPADVYLEGNDQYRGWFNSSMIISMAVNGVAPFKTCITHGWVMDENWTKMSKSAGNGIDPNKIADQFGADILRLWAASVDYHADVRLGESIIKTTTDNYRKIRNTFKFMLGNLSAYEPCPNASFGMVDRFVLAKLEDVRNRSLDAYEHYDFATVIAQITAFMSGDLSSFYLDYAKDILYCDEFHSSRRQAIVEVIYRCCRELCLLLNPILPFTMQEVYSYLPGQKKEFVQLEDMPKTTHDFGPEVLNEYQAFQELRAVALKALEDSRSAGLFGSSVDAGLILKVSDSKLQESLEQEGELSAKYFMVGELKLSPSSDNQASAYAFEGAYCPRCRCKVHSLVRHGEEEVCLRCDKALSEERQ